MLQRVLFSMAVMIGATFANGLEMDLQKTYSLWQRAMVKKDIRIWETITASTKRRDVKNRIYSERQSYPSAVFASPFNPPALGELKVLKAKATGNVAKAVFFGKVDFGIGGEPTENLLVVSYVREGQYWRFYGAEYVNLSALPELRHDLMAGDYSYLDNGEFEPGVPTRLNSIELSRPAQYIAKLYVYCPERNVRALVNGMSNHNLTNAKEAELIIGGANQGMNELQLAISNTATTKGTEPLCVRVYLMSQVNGVQPVKVCEYLVQEGEAVQGVQTLRFVVTDEVAQQLKGN